MQTILDEKYWVDLIGLDFKNNGRGPDEYDCYGLLLEIFKRMGEYAPDYVYGEDSHEYRKVFLTKMATDWEIVTDFRPGNVLVFKERSSPQHVGIMIDEDRFIHASGDRGQVCVERLSKMPTSSLTAMVRLKKK